jgi:DNA polymerase-3 subunit gamma/tau
LLDRHFPGAWRIVPSRAEGEPTLDEQGAEIVELRRVALGEHPLVRAILAAFPDATVGEPRDPSLDDYGLPPEILSTGDDDALGGEVPDLEFAPLDSDPAGADFADDD